MDSLLNATLEALKLLFSADQELWEIIGISFSVSLRAILIAIPFSILIAFPLAYFRFPGRRVLISIFHTLLSIPAVVVGLTVYLLLSRSGPMGDLRLLFTQTAMIVGQIILALPILVTMCHASFQAADKRAWETALTLGASTPQALLTIMHEIRFGLLAAIIAAFGRIIAEVGCSMMVGGNILHYTRNIPTAIALETSKGEFAQGIALGMTLLFLSLILNLGMSSLAGKGEMH